MRHSAHERRGGRAAGAWGPHLAAEGLRVLVGAAVGRRLRGRVRVHRHVDALRPQHPLALDRLHVTGGCTTDTPCSPSLGTLRPAACGSQSPQACRLSDQRGPAAVREPGVIQSCNTRESCWWLVSTLSILSVKGFLPQSAAADCRGKAAGTSRLQP